MATTDIALFQMTSGLDFKSNLDKVVATASKCQKAGVQYLFLPECFFSMSNGEQATPYLVEEGKEYFQAIQNISIDYGVALLGGSAATKYNRGVVNRTYSFDQAGKDLGHYDKKHLFACDLGSDNKITESDIYTAGHELKMIQVDDLRIGLGVCFDMRFPLEAWSYREQGANLLTYSSAFTVPTGKAHWHTLLRARAIETQCFVVACAQYGNHNEKIKTYGHSLVVGPWGNVLLDAEEGEGLHFCQIDLAEVDSVRSKIKTR